MVTIRELDELRGGTDYIDFDPDAEGVDNPQAYPNVLERMALACTGKQAGGSAKEIPRTQPGKDIYIVHVVGSFLGHPLNMKLMISKSSNYLLALWRPRLSWQVVDQNDDENKIAIEGAKSLGFSGSYSEITLDNVPLGYSALGNSLITLNKGSNDSDSFFRVVVNMLEPSRYPEIGREVYSNKFDYIVLTDYFLFLIGNWGTISKSVRCYQDTGVWKQCKSWIYTNKLGMQIDMSREFDETSIASRLKICTCNIPGREEPWEMDIPKENKSSPFQSKKKSKMVQLETTKRRFSDFYSIMSEGSGSRDAGVAETELGFRLVKRRDSLPEPKEKEKPGVCLPEPLSSLQKCFEDFEYSHLVDKAVEFGKPGNNLMRILHVAAFAVSGYASTKGRQFKHFNPLLGETYEADYPDKRLRFFSEKVSHHPMVVACHCKGSGWEFHAASNLKSKFLEHSIQLDPVGTLTLQFKDGELFQWSKVTTSLKNTDTGSKIYCDHYGSMHIKGSGNYSCKLKFKEQSIEQSPHQVCGFVEDKTGKKVAMLIGNWDKAMSYVLGDPTTKPETKPILLWERDKSATKTRYNLPPFAITLNELTPGLKKKLPPTDSRLRPDQRHLENGEYELANAEKLRLEHRQRQARSIQESGWKPQWFIKDKDDSYRYIGGYWKARRKGNWRGINDIFGQRNDNISSIPEE